MHSLPGGVAPLTFGLAFGAGAVKTPRITDPFIGGWTVLTTAFTVRARGSKEYPTLQNLDIPCARPPECAVEQMGLRPLKGTAVRIGADDLDASASALATVAYSA